ncbi:MAG: Ig-like domain-containing protein [Flavobacteriales bacterium]|nr:Ig-like domain-containing protein [Flavobacteriales bacterium]MCB9167232.1 Ig-like domain-containing protein [Flavobacteriales bacterium]
MRRPWLYLCVLGVACAQVRDPTGGPKDTDPPQLVSTSPPNGTVRSEARRIILRFNERIQLLNARKNLLVSPPMDPAPDIRQSGAYNVIIDLNAPLLPDRTYVINLGDAVSDLTEGNSARDLIYVLSTGPVIDSLRITGQVVDAFTGLPVASAIVALYEAGDTTDLTSARPAYFTRSDEAGTFDLRYLRDGAYKLRALRDQNANYRYDLPNEHIAFLEEPVRPLAPSAAPMDLELYLFQEESASQRVIDRTVTPDRAFQLVLAQRVGSAGLRNLDAVRLRPHWDLEASEGRDTLWFWPSDTVRTNGLPVVLTVDGKDLDTLTYRSLAKTPFYTALHVLREPLTDPHRVLLEASRPLVAIDTARIVLMHDSTQVRGRWTIDERNARHVSVELTSGRPLDLKAVLLPKAVTDIYGGHNDSLRLDLGRPDPRTMGVVELDLTVDSTWHLPVVVQLLDGQGRVARETRMNERRADQRWAELPAGKYRLKAIEDRNANGRWDTGELLGWRPPERVLIDPEEIGVRADWEIRVDWSAGDRTTKK